MNEYSKSMADYYEKYNAENLLVDRAFGQYQLATPAEQKLIDRVYQFENFFSDMCLRPRSITQEFISVQSKMGDSDEWHDDFTPLPQELEYVSPSNFIFRVAELEDGTLGCFERLEYRLTVKPGCEERDSVILHEMIHMYQAVLDSLPLFFHDVVLWCLYKSLRDKVTDLDARIMGHGHILNETAILNAGGRHDILFLLKSFDLDLRMEYPLGTVFGYGMAQRKIDS